MTTSSNSNTTATNTPTSNRNSNSNASNLDLLNEFAAGEDEFDVDLMACGCRVAPMPEMKLSIHDIVRMHDLDHDQLVALVGALVDESRVDSKKLFELAAKAAKNKIQESDERKSKVKKPS